MNELPVRDVLRGMVDAISITLRELNRATLARQMLLARADATPAEAIDRLMGLQAQVASAAYVGLWTRLAPFARRDLLDLIACRKVVRATLMRSTLHLVTDSAYAALRPALQPALTAGCLAILRERANGVDVDALLGEATGMLRGKPMRFSALRDLLAAAHPDADIRALAYLVRTHLPLIQVSDSSTWGYPANPAFALADEWRGAPLGDAVGLGALFRRYLRAFGPAGIADFQAWSGFASLRAMEHQLVDGLLAFRYRRGPMLYDLPDAPRPPGGVPAPPRLIPDYDNLVLSHADRTRVLANEHRSRVYLPAARIGATILADGFVAGTWSSRCSKGAATLTIQPFDALDPNVASGLREEADSLLRFAYPDASELRVDLLQPG